MSLMANRFRLICKKGSGTFADVWKCQDTKSGKQVACKRMKQCFSSVEQAENLREIIALRKIRGHENILNLHEVVYEKKSGRVVLVFELMDMNLYELIQSRHSYFVDGKVQHFMYQLCKALDYLHRHGVFHRDIKPENILIKGDLLKLGDFGSCRLIGSRPPYTEYISTRWYRPPECLLTNGCYTYKMDVWGAGCVFFEIISLKPLFPGSNEVDQVACIHHVLGTADRKTMQKFTKCKSTHIKYDFPPEVGLGIDAMLPSHTSDECRNLLKLMCRYDPDERITARQALTHPYFHRYRKARRRENRAAMVVPASECPHSSRMSMVTASPAKAKLHEAEAVNLELRPLHDSRPIIRKLKCHTHNSSSNQHSKCSSNGVCSTSHSSKTTADSILPALDVGSTAHKQKRQNLSPGKSQGFLPVIKRKL